MALSEDKVRMSASITVDRFGKKALKEIKLRVREMAEIGKADEAAFWQRVGNHVENAID